MVMHPSGGCSTPLLVYTASIFSLGVSLDPLPPLNVYVTNQGHPDRLMASWGAAAGERDGYLLTLYYAGSGSVAANASVGRDANKFTFSRLAPGHKYLLEVVSMAGPYMASAGNNSDWTSEWRAVLHLVPGSGRALCTRGTRGGKAAVQWCGVTTGHRGGGRG